MANGYTERFVSYLEDLRDKHPKVVIMAGNVVTGEMAEELILSVLILSKLVLVPDPFAQHVKKRCWLSAALSHY